MRTSRRLPPLSHLRLFEAAGRHLSFKRAAEELVVTPSAVSHGIQTLEDWLGIPLFVRTNRGLTLTTAGASYLPYVSRALATLVRGLEGIPELSASGRIRLSVAPAFASRWLLPRLSEFQDRCPDLEILLDTAPAVLDIPASGIDIAIRRGSGPWHDVDAVELVRGTTLPHCAPQLLGDRPFVPGDLEWLPVIRASLSSGDWAAWLRTAGMAAVNLRRGLQVDTVDVAIEAATNGLGAVICPGFLVADEVRTGRLLPVEGPGMPASRPYWLVGSREAMLRQEIMAFRRWLTDALAAGRPPPDD